MAHAKPHPPPATPAKSAAPERTVRVLLLSRYGPLGASSRLRSVQFISYLDAHQIHVTRHALLGDTYIETLYSGERRSILPIMAAYLARLARLLSSGSFDLVWIEKELFPYMPAWGERLLTRAGMPYVVDYDDAIFHNYDRHRNRIVRWALGKKIDRVMRDATTVIAGNPYLADRAHQVGARHIEQLPTVVDTRRYLPVTKNDDGQRALRIGWIGSPATEHYCATLFAAARRLESQRKVEIVLIGASARLAEQEQLRCGPGVLVQCIAWSELAEVTALQSLDIGVMPLPDEPWERGKCGYKLIQYMACGLPVVASPVGVNRDIVEHGVHGYHATSLDSWCDGLETLMHDAELRAAMGERGRALVEERYALEAAAPELCRILREAAR